jgi:hypothetical protein
MRKPEKYVITFLILLGAWFLGFFMFIFLPGEYILPERGIWHSVGLWLGLIMTLITAVLTSWAISHCKFYPN